MANQKYCSDMLTSTGSDIVRMGMSGGGGAQFAGSWANSMVLRTEIPQFCSITRVLSPDISDTMTSLPGDYTVLSMYALHM